MKKIMFNDKYFMTRSVLVGEKTNTRRIISEKLFQECRSNGLIEAGGFNSQWEVKTKELLLAKSPYKVGEEVAVAQSYRDVCHEVFLFSTKVKGKEYRQGWGNKMFVRADLMPHRIRITNVRVERLQDISDEDCLKEGVIRKYHSLQGREFKDMPFYRIDGKTDYKTPREAFAALIDKICGRGTWDSNPWVFVYDFELVK